MSEILQRILDVLKDQSVFYMATVDSGSPRLRPMTLLAHDGVKIWTTSHKRAQKMEQLVKQNEVEACFVDEMNRQVRIRGKVQVHDDEESWNKLRSATEDIPQIHDPNYVLLLIEPEEVRYIDDWSLEYKSLPLDEIKTS